MAINLSPGAADHVSEVLVSKMSELQISELSLPSREVPGKRAGGLSTRRHEKVFDLSFTLPPLQSSYVSPQNRFLVSPKVVLLPSQKELLSLKMLYNTASLHCITSFLFNIPKTAEEALNFFQQDGISLYLACKTINRKMIEVTKSALSFIRKEGVVERMIIKNMPIPRFFRHTVTQLAFSNMDFSLIVKSKIPSIPQLARSFPNIAELSLRSCRMQQAHLELLGSFQKLRILKIYEDDAVSDEGINALQGVLKPLKKLVLFSCSNITDTAVKTIAAHARNITSLSLAYCNITTLEEVSKMTLLNDLSLAGCTKLKQAMLIHLLKCRLLKSLDLSRNHISDQGLIHLAKLELLKELFLNNCKPVLEGVCCWKISRKITFHGLSLTLLGHNHLQTLQVNGIEATPQEIQSLQKRFSEKNVKEADPQKTPSMRIYNRRNEREKRHVYMAPAEMPKNMWHNTKGGLFKQSLVGNLTAS